MMLKVTNLTKIFGGLKAVDGASLEVGQGRIVALIGPNGAGKTTLFACIAGFLPINQGRVELLGQDITGMKVHDIARLGMVRTFQITQPFAKLTVLENIAVGSHQLHERRADALAHARTVAERAPAAAASRRRPGTTLAGANTTR
jgi:branched-chain amino acid transport system ATP-binding protein